MQLNNKAVKEFVQDKQTKKSLTFGQSNLTEMTKISTDDNVGRLLTTLDGEIELKTQGKGSRARVVFKSGKARLSISLGEFVRILNAPTLIKTAIKAAKNDESFDELSQYIATIMEVENVDINHIKPIDADTLAKIKQSLAELRILKKNLETAELLADKFPDDPLGPHLHSYVTVAISIVANGITHLAKGDMKISESNAENMAKLGMPNWIFQRIKKVNIEGNTTPTLYFFPRKKENGLTMTTNELRDPNMVEMNSALLARSQLLIDLVSDDTFVREVVPKFDEHIKDEVGLEIYKNFPWHVFPLLGRESVREFLLLKEKNVTNQIFDHGGTNLKRRLNKLGNALLRTSMLENGGGRPEIDICKNLCHDYAETDWYPSTGSFYTVLANKPYAEEKVGDYLNQSSAGATGLFFHLLSTELGQSFSAEVKKLIHTKPFGLEVVAIPENWKAFLPGLVSGKTVFGKGVFPNKPDCPVGVGDMDLLLKKQVIQTGDPRMISVKQLEKALFKVYKHDKLGEEGNNTPSNTTPNIRLGPNGKKFADLVERELNFKAAEKVRDFLRGFSYMKMQEIALGRLNAQMEKGLGAFIERESTNVDVTEIEEYVSLEFES